MLGASQTVVLGTAATGSAPTYDASVVHLEGVVSYWKFQNDGSDAKGAHTATITGSPELQVETIVHLDTVAEGAPVDGECIAWPGSTGSYAEVAHNSAHKTAAGAIVVTFQHDLLGVKSTLLAADRSVGGTSAGPGGLSIEVNADGTPRCYLRRQSDGAVVDLAGQAGDVQVGQAYCLIFKWGGGGLSMALWNASGNLVRRVTDPLADGVSGTSPIRFGAWHADISHHDGPYGRVVWFRRRISDLEEATLASARTIARDQVPVPVGCAYLGEVYRPVQNVSKPNYLAAYEDSISFPGIILRRIAANPGVPVLGTTWPGLSKHQYIKAQPWSHDEALIFMNHTGLGDDSTLFIDGHDYAVRFKRSLPADRRIMKWRPNHADQIIYVAGKQVWVYDPYAHSTTQISSFNPSNYNFLSLGKIDNGNGQEANPSYDGDMIVVSGRDSSGNPVAFAYNLQTDTKYTEFNPDAASGAGDHDWISIDASGQYIVRAHQGGNDITVWNLSGTVVGNSRPSGGMVGQALADRLKHVDCTLSGDGNTPYLVYIDRLDSDRIARCTLPGLTNVQKYTSGSSAFVSHASARQYRPRADGKRFGSSFGSGSDGQALFKALLRFDVDNGDIHQFGHHRTAGPSSTTGSESWHTLSPGATRSIFTSTWQGTGSSNEQLYVVEHCESF